MIAYICGPCRGSTFSERNKNIAKAATVALEVWGLGYAVICPHTNTSHFNMVGQKIGFTEEDWINAYMDLVRVSDILVLIPGWENSEGSKQEIDYAKSLGKKIYYDIKDVPNIRVR